MGIMLTRFPRRFTGIEFAVVHAQPQHPSIFIIHKRERLSPDEGLRSILLLKSVEHIVNRLH